MDTVHPIEDITHKTCDRDFELDLIESTSADDFVYHGNGATSDKAGYGRAYRERYESIDRPEFEELFAVEGQVVAAYTLAPHRRDGTTERMAAMARGSARDHCRAARHRASPDGLARARGSDVLARVE